MSDIDKLNPKALNRRRGFRSLNPEAMTAVERMRKWRTKNGGRSISYYASPEVGAALIYLRKQWGFKSNQEIVDASLRFLVICTRQGLKRLPQTIDLD